MLWSKYNSIFSLNNENSEYLLYNSLSNSLSVIDINQFHLFSKIKDNINEIQNINSDLKKQLIESKIIANDEEEVLKMKLYTQKARFDNNNLVLTLLPTLDCNFACPYCYEKKSKSYMSDNIEDEIIKFINSFPGIKTIHVTWMGGEPLLCIERIRSITKKIKNLQIAYTSSIVTNGYFLNDLLNYFNELNIESIQITIDGLKEIHNKRRICKNDTDSFSKIISNLIELRDSFKNLPVNIRVNIDETNKNEFIELHRFLNDKIPNHNFFITPAFVENVGIEKKYCDLDRIKQVNFQIEQFEKNNWVAIDTYPSNMRNECGVKNINHFTIGPQGELYKCWNDIGDKTKEVGSVFDKSYYNNPLWIKYMCASDPFEDNECNKCNLLPICNGGCPEKRIKKEYEKQTVDYCSKFKDDGLEKFLKCHFIKSIQNESNLPSDNNI